MPRHPFTITCREEGKGKPSVTGFATLAEASAHIQERWQGADYMDGRDGFHTDFSTYELRGFTLNDIGKTSYDEGRQFTFNPPPRTAPVPPFIVHENIDLFDKAKERIPHTFGSLDEVSDFLHDRMAVEQCEPSGPMTIVATIYEKTESRMDPLVRAGTKVYATDGFALADIGRVEETQDGEHAMLILAIDEKQEKQITAFIDPSEKDSQFAHLSAAELDTCHRVGAYVGDWNDRQFEKTFGKPYSEPAEPRTPFFLRLPSEQAPGTEGSGKGIDTLPF
jgi:hypothetical protein